MRLIVALHRASGTSTVIITVPLCCQAIGTARIVRESDLATCMLKVVVDVVTGHNLLSRLAP